MSKSHEVAGQKVTLAMDPEFQSFSDDELKRFSPGWKQQGIIVEELHNGASYSIELEEAKAEAELNARLLAEAKEAAYKADIEAKAEAERAAKEKADAKAKAEAEKAAKKLAEEQAKAEADAKKKAEEDAKKDPPKE